MRSQDAHEIGNIFIELDKDGDGSLSLDEFSNIKDALECLNAQGQ